MVYAKAMAQEVHFKRDFAAESVRQCAGVLGEQREARHELSGIILTALISAAVKGHRQRPCPAGMSTGAQVWPQVWHLWPGSLASPPPVLPKVGWS